MNILWICNITFPEALEKITGEKNLKASGGWLLGLANSLVNQPNISLFVASTSDCVKELTQIKGDKITHFIIPLGKGNLKENPEYEKYWKQIVSIVNPDITHIHGTEFSHSLSFLKGCQNTKTLVSVQGLTTAISKNYFAGITKKDIIRNFSPLEILFGCKQSYKKRSFFEKKILQNVSHIIGHTKWDYSIVKKINPSATYYKCNETLRESFYFSKWDYKSCQKHTIFLSQAGYTIKGFHQVLKAINLLTIKYSDIQVRIAGEKIINLPKSFYARTFWSGYAKLIIQMIRKFHLEKHIQFIGPKDEYEIKSELLKTNLFICPSSIENCPNSLGEAQLLGVPCIASNVGGISEMIPTHKHGYLYEFENFEKLANLIDEVFSNAANMDNSEMQRLAQDRHNKGKNLQDLINIYKDIVSPCAACEIDYSI